jgi:Coenzyme PQQ synthesis protein D (PqqD)
MQADINLNSRVRIHDDVLFQELQGEAVLLNLKTGVYLGLDQVGTRIWQLLQAEGALSRVLELMIEEYNVTQERCAKDLLDLVGQMEKQQLVEVS